MGARDTGRGRVPKWDASNGEKHQPWKKEKNNTERERRDVYLDKNARVSQIGRHQWGEKKGSRSSE